MLLWFRLSADTVWSKYLHRLITIYVLFFLLVFYLMLKQDKETFLILNLLLVKSTISTMQK